MDFNGVLTADEVREVETAVNEVIVKNLPVEITYPSKEELKTLDYRSKIEIEGQVRIVTIPGVDVCACCAPHVKKTGEIGMLNVQSLSNYKGGVRISILSGFRALEGRTEKITGNFFYLRYTFRQSGVTARTCGKIQNSPTRI